MSGSGNKAKPNKRLLDWGGRAMSLTCEINENE